MRRREQDDDASPYLFCERCQQMSERMLIQECPFCFKDFCRACLAVSVGDPVLDASLAARDVRFPEGELRWVPAAQRHLTLRFFDELPEDRVEDVRGAADVLHAVFVKFVEKTKCQVALG